MLFNKLLKYEISHTPQWLPLLPILAGMFLSACSTLDGIGTPANPEKWVEREINACLPTAILFKESLQKYSVWSEVITYRSFNPETGRAANHAIVVFNYPKGTENYWTYDFEGSFKIEKDARSIASQNAPARDTAKTDIETIDPKNPLDIARFAEAKRFRPRSHILGAEFLN